MVFINALSSPLQAVNDINNGMLKLAQSVKKATVRIDAYSNSGRLKSANGIFVSPEGHVVTTRHITDDAASIIVVSSLSDKPMVATVILNHPSAHLSLLQVGTSDELKAGKKTLLKQPYLSIGHGAFPLWPKSRQNAEVVTVSLNSSNFDAEANLRQIEGFSDPWVDSGLSNLSSKRDELAEGITVGNKKVDNLSMVAYKMNKVPLSETGGPAFTLGGKLLGIVSFLHRKDAVNGVTCYSHIVPVSYIADLMSGACRPEIATFHGTDTEILKPLVNLFDQQLTPSDKSFAFQERRKYITSVVNSLPKSGPDIVKNLKTENTFTEGTFARKPGDTGGQSAAHTAGQRAGVTFDGGCPDDDMAAFRRNSQFGNGGKRKKRRSGKISEDQVSVFPERVQAIHRKHPDWSFSILTAIYHRKPVVGMTESQVRSAVGAPKKVVRDGDVVKGQSCNIWYYDRGPLLSFRTDKKLLTRVW
jgi:hypothetical protein